MDPISLIAGVTSLIGLGAKIFGTDQSVSGSKQVAQVSKNIAADEQRAEAQRAQMMELENSRAQREAIRNSQRAQALGLAAATNQGAQFGSGLQGAYGQIAGETGTIMTNLSQNLQIGRNIFGINADISGQKMAMADAQSKIATGQGYSALGSGLMTGALPFAKVATTLPSLFGGSGSSFGSASNSAIY